MKPEPTLDPTPAVREVIDASVQLTKLRAKFRLTRDMAVIQEMVGPENVIRKHVNIGRVDIHKMAAFIVEAASESFRAVVQHAPYLSPKPPPESRPMVSLLLYDACKTYLEAQARVQEAEAVLRRASASLTNLTKVPTDNTEALNSIATLIAGSKPYAPEGIQPSKSKSKSKKDRPAPPRITLKNPDGKIKSLLEGAIAMLIQSQKTMGSNAIAKSLKTHGWTWGEVRTASVIAALQSALHGAVRDGKRVKHVEGKGFSVSAS